MGSWNATCNISQLPITPGTPVRALFLGRCQYSMDPPNEMKIGEGNNSREGCYPTDFWYPRTVPLKAVYSDYGEVSDVEEGLALELFWEQLKTDMLVVEAGENKVHEPSATLDMNWDQMWDVAAEGRLRVNGNHGRFDYGKEGNSTMQWKNRKPSKPLPLPVSVVLIREDVFQAMLNLKNPWSYKPNESIDVQYFVKRYKKVLENEQGYSKDFARSMAIRDSGLEHINPPFTLGLSFYLEQFAARVDQGELTLDSPEAVELLQKIGEIAFINSMYSVLRRTWHPGTGCGSQSTEYEANAQFHEAMANVGYNAFEADQKERAEWDEEYTPRKANRLNK